MAWEVRWGRLEAEMHRAIWAVKRAHWWTWMAARKLLREKSSDRAKVALTPARFDVLFALLERGKMMQRSLRKVLGVVASTISEMLKDLEARGLVVRGPRSKAGRSVELTAKGKVALDHSWWPYYGVDDVVATAFGDDRGADWDVRMLLWERTCRRLRHACGDTQFTKPFGWVIYEED